MYRWMSLSGSSASRNSIWAMTRLAISSSMYVGRKMIRSLRSREKMSNARSPRGVCSTTIGTKPIERLLLAWSEAPLVDIAPLVYLRRHRRSINKEVERALLAEGVADPVQVAALLEHRAHCGRRPLARLGQALDLRVHVGITGGEALFLRDGLDEQRALDRLFRAGPHLAEQLLVVPGHALGIHPLAPHLLADVLDLVSHLSEHEGLGDFERMLVQGGLEHRRLEPPAILLLPALLEP